MNKSCLGWRTKTLIRQSIMKIWASNNFKYKKNLRSYKKENSSASKTILKMLISKETTLMNFKKFKISKINGVQPTITKFNNNLRMKEPNSLYSINKTIFRLLVCLEIINLKIKETRI